ncbi:MAG: SHOCT domain-containing protein [Clostridia bacterium]|nr:SHOCT domain-containing protein [Clostridia bacterium]
MCLTVLTGIILFSVSFTTNSWGEFIVNYGTLFGGIGSILLGPIVIQLLWLSSDIFFNFILDVKNIKNAQLGLPTSELSPPLFHKNCQKSVGIDNVYSVFEKIKKFKLLLDEGIITEEEYVEIKNELLNKKEKVGSKFDKDIVKIKQLKTYVDEKILSKEEFDDEKNKILKK